MKISLAGDHPSHRLSSLLLIYSWVYLSNMIVRITLVSAWLMKCLLILISLSHLAHASLGDRLPDFRQCVLVGLICIDRLTLVTNTYRLAFTRIAVMGIPSFVSIKDSGLIESGSWAYQASNSFAYTSLDVSLKLRPCLSTYNHRSPII